MEKFFEPWNLKPSDIRVADSLRTFIIFCEDEHHEPLYLKSFEKQFQDLKINAIGNQKQKKLNLNNTIKTSLDMGLIVFEDNKYKVMPGITEHLWCVYDRDMENEDFKLIPMQNNIEFDTAIQTAESSGLKVAWSNDVFEMWLLLHFEPIPQGRLLHRSYIYERLTYIFKNIVPRSKELDEITTKPTFNYKDNLKRRDVFINHVIPLLHLRIIIAMENARMLEDQFTISTPFHLRNPCTMVHHLIDEIINK